MSKLKLYTIRDSEAAVYAQPFTAVNDSVAVRMLERAAKDPESNVFHFPEQFSLYYIGEHCGDTGAIEPVDPVLVAKAVDLVVE